jgi:NAD(P)-dependent dehydrogenase (short-subunit alcohol dehydrogenase family)
MRRFDSVPRLQVVEEYWGSTGRVRAGSLKAEGEVRPLRLDITDRTTMEAAVQRIGEAHGKLHVLVNNAGIAGGGIDALTAVLEMVKRIFETNVWGRLTLTQLAAPLLRAAGSARVVNVSSSAGL